MNPAYRCKSFFLSFVVIATLGCGSEGSSGDGSDKPSDDPQSIPDDPADVIGTFRLGTTTGDPPRNHDLWVVNHNRSTFQRYPVDSGGGVTVPLEDFQEAHVYSFQLIEPSDVRVAALDFSARLDGRQARIRYGGGYGFDFGTLVLPLTARNTIDRSGSWNAVSLGGGFSLAKDASQAFANLKPPQPVKSWKVGSYLSITNPEVLLRAFYRRDENPDLFASELARNTRIFVGGRAKKKESVTSPRLVGNASWKTGARFAATLDKTWSQASRWADSRYRFPTEKAPAFSGYIYPGRLPKENQILVFEFLVSDGPRKTLPRILQTVFSTPPRVTHISLDGTSPSPIDYSANDVQNGLTEPFCFRQDDVSLVVEAPLDGNGDSTSLEEVPRVEVTLSYFAIEKGRTSRKKPSAESFPAEFRDRRADTPSSGVTRTWDPETGTLTLDLEDAAFGQSSLEVSLWQELFLSSIEGVDIAKTQLRLGYTASGSLRRSEGVVWISTECT